MSALKIWKAGLPGCLGMALIAALLASSGSLYAQTDKSKEKNKGKDASAPAPAKSAPAPATSAPVVHSTPPVSQPGGRSSAPPANTGGGNVPNNAGRGTPPINTGRGAAPNNPSGGSAPNNTGRDNAPNSIGRGPATNTPSGGSAPNSTGRDTGPNGFGRGAAPNNGGRDNAPNTFGRGAAPNTNGRDSAPNTFGRGANPGVNAGRGPSAPGPAGRPNAGPRPEFRGSNGASARFAPSGHPTVVRTGGGATIVHAPSGARRIEVVRPGGRVIVTNAAGNGYAQRPITVRGQAFVQRTYYSHGVAYPRYYRASVYRGITFNVYTPKSYYTPRFYSWAYTPWRSPVYYRFDWMGSPWMGFYAGYFSPYPYYSGPNYWLTDYLLAMSLQDAYQERMDAAAAARADYDSYGQVALSPRVKDLIAAEVQRQLNQESVESQNAAMALGANGAPPMLADNYPHVFVVSSSLIANAEGRECALTQGDVLQLSTAPSPDPSFANVQVLASKGQDCQPGNLIPVQLADLQEMQNHMRETLDQGLAELQTRQGQSGLPPIDASLRAQTQASYAADLPPAETNVAAELQQQAQEADTQEQAVLGQAGQAAPAADAPPTVQLGQTIAEVVALLGNPSRIADLGQKKTYFYQDMKVVFVDGRVSDVQ